MRTRIRALRAENEAERRLVNQFYAEKEKLNQNLSLQREQKEKKEGALLAVKRQLTDTLEKNSFAVGLHRERIKQIMLLKENNSVENLLAIELVLKDLEDENRLVAQELKRENATLGKEVKELGVANDGLKFTMRMKGNQLSTQVRQEFERASEELRSKYELRMAKLRQEKEEANSQCIASLEEEKQEKFKELTAAHNAKYRDIKNYYNEIVSTNLARINDLKGEIQSAQLSDEKDRKLLLKAEETFRRLSEPLRRITDEITRLKEDRERWQEVKKEKAQLRDRLSELTRALRDVEFQHELRLQQLLFLRRDSTALRNGTDSRLGETFQKSGLRDLILDRELQLLQAELNTRDAQVRETLLRFALDPSERAAVESSLASTRGKQRATLESLRDQISQVRHAHIQLVRNCEELLHANGLPSSEMGFLPKLPPIK